METTTNHVSFLNVCFLFSLSLFTIEWIHRFLPCGRPRGCGAKHSNGCGGLCRPRGRSGPPDKVKSTKDCSFQNLSLPPQVCDNHRSQSCSERLDALSLLSANDGSGSGLWYPVPPLRFPSLLSLKSPHNSGWPLQLAKVELALGHLNAKEVFCFRLLRFLCVKKIFF